jgi:hypothetical protein
LNQITDLHICQLLFEGKKQAVKSDNPPTINASHPDAEADDADPSTDILASKSKIVEGTDVEGKRWKLKIVIFLLFVIATVTTLSEYS